MNHGSELPGEHLNRALSGVLLVPIPLYPFILPLIFTEARGEDPSKCEIEQPAFYSSSFLILSQFDFVFKKVLKSCNFKGSGEHRNTKGNWELIFEISCAYYRSQTIGNKNWFGSEAFFFDMIFAFCRSAAFVEAQASHSTVIPCGKGRGRGQWPVFTGTVSFGYTVLGNADSDVRKEILLVRPLMSIWHWPNFLT